MSTSDSRWKPGVSVIIPVYNGRSSIQRCLESVLASRGVPGGFDVICVDNGSTDGTLDIVRRFGPSVHLLTEATRGAAAARNAGLRAAAREFTAFTDADCFVDSSWLAHLMAPLREGTADAVGGRIRARPEARSVERFGEMIHDHRKAIEFSRPPYLITMNLAARTGYLHDLGLFDEGFLRSQDVELSFRMVAAGARLAYRHDAVIYHHNRDSLFALAREGFVHGLHRPALFEVHGAHIHEYKAARVGQRRKPVPPIPLSEVRLYRWQVWLYTRVFRAARRFGESRGRREIPPA